MKLHDGRRYLTVLTTRRIDSPAALAFCLKGSSISPMQLAHMAQSDEA